MSGLCENCLQGYVLNGTPAGSFEGTAYFHPASSTDSKKAVVLITDIFGLQLVNPKLIADKYSERLKCDVWVPDIFNGNPPFTESQLGPHLPDIPGTSTSILNKLKYIWTVIIGLPGIIRNRPSVVDPRTTDFLKRIKEEKKYEKIGVVGFCFGGAQAIRLGSTGLFNSAVIAHPGLFSNSDLEAMKIPTSWACAEEDEFFGQERRAEAEAICKRKQETSKLDYEFQVYEGTCHGFASRPNLAREEGKKGFEGSFDQTVAWFEKTLA